MDIDHRTYYPIVLVTVRPATSWDDLYDETDKAMNRLIDLTVNNCNANEEKSETGNDRGDASGNGDEKYNTNDDKTETANITPDRGDENNNNIHSTVLERNSNGTPHTENSATRDRGGSNKTRPGVSEFVVDISDIGLSMYWTVQFLVSALLYYRTVIPLIFKTALVVCPNSVIRNIAKTILSVYSFGVKVRFASSVAEALEKARNDDDDDDSDDDTNENDDIDDDDDSSDDSSDDDDDTTLQRTNLDVPLSSLHISSSPSTSIEKQKENLGIRPTMRERRQSISAPNSPKTPFRSLLSKNPATEHKPTPFTLSSTPSSSAAAPSASSCSSALGLFSFLPTSISVTPASSLSSSSSLSNTSGHTSGSNQRNMNSSGSNDEDGGGDSGESDESDDEYRMNLGENGMLITKIELPVRLIPCREIPLVTLDPSIGLPRIPRISSWSSFFNRE